jgi:hypothetical protein
MPRFTALLQRIAPPTLLLLCWGLQQGLLLQLAGNA